MTILQFSKERVKIEINWYIGWITNQDLLDYVKNDKTN